MLQLTAVKNQDGTHTVSYNAQFNGKPWALTIAIWYGKKITATTPANGIVSWSVKQNPDLPVPTTGSITFDPRAWGSSAFVTYTGYVATSESQTGQDTVTVFAEKVTIKI